MKSTVVDESLSSFKPMYCSREYQASTRLSQQYEKSTSNQSAYRKYYSYETSLFKLVNDTLLAMENKLINVGLKIFSKTEL